MRKFSSYGPISTDLHYYAPRQALIDQAVADLVGENPTQGGHYVTVWAPRQRGKTWILQQALRRLRHDPQYGVFDVVYLGLEYLKLEQDAAGIAQSFARQFSQAMALPPREIREIKELEQLFHRDVLQKPLILILDEFDVLTEEAIGGVAGVFRNIYNQRQAEADRPTGEKTYLLHGIALIGVRAVLGAENPRGSPFNVQRSLHVPNLTFEEVQGLFDWYGRESGQAVEPAVVERLFYETQGQPGLTCWFGELLTETYNPDPSRSIGMAECEHVYAAASHVLPNNTILNIISKARQEPYKGYVLDMFRTDEQVIFKYDDPILNYLYLNGVVDWEWGSATIPQVKFPCPFVQSGCSAISRGSCSARAGGSMTRSRISATRSPTPAWMCATCCGATSVTRSRIAPGCSRMRPGAPICASTRRSIISTCLSICAVFSMGMVGSPIRSFRPAMARWIS